jgi:hypothetical protein
MTIGGNEVGTEFEDAQRLKGQSGSPGDDGRLGAGPEDDYADEGYDESQRAEILEVESLGPLSEDGVLQTDLIPDTGGGDADDDEIEDDADRIDTIEDTDEPFVRDDD